MTTIIELFYLVKVKLKLAKVTLLLFAIISLPFIGCGKKQDIIHGSFQKKEEDNKLDDKMHLATKYIKSVVKVTIDNIYIGNKYNESNDLQILFKKSMFNDLC